MDVLNCCGAYGRKANFNDWINGLDFKVIDGPYFSIRDSKALLANGYSKIVFYYTAGNKAFEVVLK